ncbi:IS200/IS605 family transposase [Microbispora siamensis]
MRVRSVGTNRHRVFVLHAHSVFPTKFRHRVSTGAHLERMEQIMQDVCADFVSELAEFKSEATHVHLLVNFPPKVAVSRLAGSFKGGSSRRSATGIPEPARHNQANTLWSGSYFAGSVGGAPISILRQ